jgi:hypothetical protein
VMIPKCAASRCTVKISCCDVPLTVRCRRQPLFTLLLSTFTDRYEDAHPLLSGAISSLFDDNNTTTLPQGYVLRKKINRFSSWLNDCCKECKKSANHQSSERFDLAPGQQGVTVSFQTSDREDETQKTHSAEEDEETKNRRRKGKMP